MGISRIRTTDEQKQPTGAQRWTMNLRLPKPVVAGAILTALVLALFITQAAISLAPQVNAQAPQLALYLDQDHHPDRSFPAAPSLSHTLLPQDYAAPPADPSPANQPQQIAITVAPTTLGEDSVATDIAVTATLPGTQSSATTVTLSLAGTANQGTDYSVEGTLPTITISLGQTQGSANVILAPTNDTVWEGDETIIISGTATGGLEVAAATLTLSDNENRPTIELYFDPQIPTIDFIIPEESGTPRDFTIHAKLNGESTLEVDTPISLSLYNSDNPGSNYTVTLPAMEIEAGNTTDTATATFTPVDNSERDRSRGIRIAGAADDHLGTPFTVTTTTGRVTIVDDETPLKIDLSLTPVLLREADLTEDEPVSFDVTVTLSGDDTLPSEVTVELYESIDECNLFKNGRIAEMVFPQGATSTSLTKQQTVSVTPTGAAIDKVCGFSIKAEATNYDPSPFQITIIPDENPSLLSATIGSFGTSYEPANILNYGETLGIAFSFNRPFRIVGGSASTTVQIGDTTRTETCENAAGQLICRFPVQLGEHDLDGIHHHDLGPLTITGSTEDWYDSTISVTVDTNLAESDISSHETYTVHGAPSSYRLLPSIESLQEGQDPTNIRITATWLAGLTANQDTTFPISLTDVTTTGADYTVTGTEAITILAGDISGNTTIEFTPVEDGIKEARSETVLIEGGNSDNFVLGAEFEVIDSPNIKLTVPTETIAENAGAETVTVTAELEDPGDSTRGRPIVVSLNVSGSADLGDYTFAETLQVTIPAGARSGSTTFTLTPTDDRLLEGDETIVLSGSTPALTVVGTGTITIEDDETEPQVILTADPDTIQENDSVPTQITVSAILAQNITLPDDATVVTLTLGGTATAGAGHDYTSTWNPQLAQITIPQGARAGESTVTLTVTPLHDEVAEGEETIVVQGTASTDLVVDVRGSTITLVDDDIPGIVLDPKSIEVTEGNSATYTVALALEPTVTVTVTMTTHLDSTDLSLDTTELYFTPENWDQPQTVNMEAMEDLDAVDDPTLTLVHEASGGPYDDVASNNTVTIKENDAPNVTVSSTTLQMPEGTNGTYSLVLTSEPSGDVLITMDTDLANTDLSTTPSPTQLTFTPLNWNQPQLITVSAAVDADAIDDPAVTLAHSATGGDYGDVTVSSVTITIIEQTIPTLSVTGGSAGEGASVDFVVTLSTASSKTVTVGYATADDTAVSPDDYTPASSSLTFAPRQNSKTVAVATINDIVHEPPETFTLELTNPINADLQNAAETATGTITDDDPAPTRVTLSLNPAIVDETAAATDITVTATLNNSPYPTVTTVTVSRTGGTADSGTDYQTISNFTITIPAEQTTGTATLSFNPTGDDLAEGDETVILTGTATALTSGTTTLTITNISRDKTLSALDLEDNNSTAITLTPTFASATTSYTADVLHRVDEITVKPTVRDSNATYEIQNTAGTALTDSDSNTTGFQVGLSEGTNTIKVEVTAEDNSAQTYTVAVTRTINTVATGNPTISGTAEVGQVLTADTTNISDAQGKTKAENDDPGYAYTYQWLRVDNGIETSLPAENAETYTLVIPDEGKKLKVKVDFTDDAGTSEGPLVSDAYPSTGDVIPERNPTVSISADRTSAVFREDSITYTLNRTGTATAALDVSVALTQTKDFLAPVDRSRIITIPAGQTTETFTVPASSFQHFAVGTMVEPGTLTATIQDNTDYELGTPSTLDVAIVIGPMIQIENASYTVSEADGTILVKLIARTSQGAPQPTEDTGSVSLSLEDVSATRGTDYSSDATVNFIFEHTLFTTVNGAWQAEKTHPISITNDDLDEEDETFLLNLKNLPNMGDNPLVDASGNACDTTDGCSVTVTITDDDTTGVSLSESTLSIPEGMNRTYSVALTSQPTGEVTITMVTDLAGTDLSTTPSPMELTFTTSNWNQAQTVTVSAAVDADAVDDPAVTLAHSATGGDYGDVTVSSVTVTITEQTVPTLSVTGASAREGASVDFIVTLSVPSSQTVAVAYATADDTAVSPDDYAAASSSLTFAPGQTSKTVAVATINDIFHESTETFTLELTNPTNAEIQSGAGTATGTITDDDPAPTAVTLSLNPAAVSESAAATAVTITASLNNSPLPTATTVTVSRTGGTATPATDYPAVTDFVITIPAEQTTGTATLSFDPTGDSLYEGDETVILTGNAAGLAADTATLTITDDDTAPTAVILSLNPSAVSESATATTVTVTASLNNSPLPTATTVTVTKTGGTATSGTDYTSINAFTVTIPSGQATGTAQLSFDPTGDSLAEGNESVILTGSAAGLDAGAATLTITDDDAAPTAVSLSLNPTAVGESATATTVTVTASLNNSPLPSPTTVTVSRTGGTATSATDYPAISDFTVAIPAGQTSGTTTLSFNPSGDNLAEGDETVILTGTVAGLTSGTTTLTITDDDTAPTAVSISLDPAAVSEGANTTAITVTASLDNSPLPTATTVSVTKTGGTATSGADYPTISNFNVTIQAGDTTGTATLSFNPTGDGLAEDDETVILTASAPDLTPGTAILTITDDDDAPTAVSLSLNPASIGESQAATDITITVSLNNSPLPDATSITVTKTGGTATSGTDYPMVTTFTIEIPPEQNSNTAILSFDPTHDNLHEGNETVILTATATGLTSNTATLTITDDDPAPTAITLSLNPTAVTETAAATAITVTATLNNSPLPTATTVTVTRTGGTATSGTDHPTVSAFTITIPSGQTTGTAQLSFDPSGDALAEGDETVILTGTATGLTSGTATLTITDDDPAPTTVSLSLNPTSVSESAASTAITVTASFNNSPLPTATTVTVSRTGGTATSATDHPPISDFTVTIPSGHTSATATLSFDPSGDNLAEGDETVILTGSTNGLNPATATLTITDDDTAPTTVILSLTPSTVSESAEATPVTITTSLNGSPLPTATTVTVSRTGGTATSGTDYQTISNLTVTIQPGHTSGTTTLSFNPSGDDLAEGSETVILTATATGLNPGTATLTITDDDPAPTAITLSLDPPTVAENAAPTAITVTASLNNSPLPTATTVTVSRTAGTATSGTDHPPVSDFTVTIQAGHTSGTAQLSFDPTQDNLAEGVETVVLTASATALDAASATLAITDDDPAPTGVTLSLDPTSVAEEASATTFTATATLNNSPLSTATTVTISSTGGTATSGTDYPPITDLTLTIPAEQTSGTAQFSFTPTGDTLAEGNETVILTASVTGLTPGTATLTITDNDAAPTALILSLSPNSVGEGAPATAVTVTASLNNSPLPTATTVTVSRTGGTATSATDYPAITNFMLTIPARQTLTTAQLSFDPTQDHLAEGDETLILTASATNLTAGTATLTITDDDTAGVTVSDATLSIQEGQSDTYTVVLNTQPAGTVTVTVSGHAGTDVSLDQTTLTFSALTWSTAQTVTATAGEDNDSRDELDATLSHTVASTTDSTYNGIAAQDVTVSITDDDADGVTISETSLTIVEESSDTYTVVLDTQPAGNVTVTISGHAGTDVSLDKTTLTFNAITWHAPQTVTATAVDDSDSQDEIVHTLSHAVTSTADTNYNGVAAASVNVSITDDDEDGVTVSPTDLAVTEGQTDTYTVVLDTKPTGNVTVTVNDPTDNPDVTADPPSLAFTTTNWNAPRTVTVTAAQDDDAVNEIATITHTVSGYGTTTTADDVTVTIEDDAPGSLTVNFKETTYTAAEGATVDVTVTLDQDPERTITVLLTPSGEGGATSTDYSGVPGNVTFNTGDTEATFTFAATDDSDDDDGESVRLTFGTLPAGVSAGTTNETVVSITDNDATVDPLQQVQVSFGAYDYAVPEGGSTTVAVQLNNDPERTLTIPLNSTPQDGASAADYNVVPNIVTFNSGDTQATFTFAAAQDSIADSGETVKLTFGNLPDAVTAGSPAEAIFSILDRIPVTFDAEAYSATEGGPDATVTVLLGSPAPGQIYIPLTQEGQHGAIEADWSGVPEGLTFNAGATSKSFTLIAVNDAVYDDGEIVELGFGALPSNFIPGTPATARVTLMNNDEDPAEPVLNRCPDDSGDRLILLGNGHIGQAGESDFWRVPVDPWRFYVLEVLGSDGDSDILGAPNPGNLTLSDPHLSTVWSGDRSEMLKRSSSRRRTRFSIDRAGDFSGFQQYEVRSFGNNTGNYQIKIRVNNICMITDGTTIYPYNGGPDGYTSDRPADPTTGDTFRLRPRPSTTISQSFTAFLGDNWDWYWNQVPDEDWFAIEGASHDYEYTITVQTMDDLPAKHQATRLKILAIYDSNGTEVPGTSTTGSGKKVSVTFQPDNTGLFYASVGSDPSDRTGVYQIVISATTPSEDSNQEHRSEPPAEPDKTEKDQSKANGSPDDRNSSATGIVSITGTAQVGQTLTADASGISDPDGMQTATLTYRWMMDGTNIQNARDSSYTLAKDAEGRTIQVSIRFTDDAGNTEVLTSPPTAPVEPRPNSPATGVVVITGTAQVGQTLTADTSNISDADGLTRVDFRYQWTVDGTEVAGKTGPTYTPVDSDAGKTVKLRLRFIDDRSNAEELTSSPTQSVAPEPDDPQESEPEDTTPSGPPSAPQNLSVSPAGPETLAVNWDAPLDLGGADSVMYMVQWKKTTASWSANADISSSVVSDTHHNITGLTAATNYAVRVFAFNASQGGPDSGEVTSTPR